MSHQGNIITQERGDHAGTGPKETHESKASKKVDGEDSDGEHTTLFFVMRKLKLQ